MKRILITGANSYIGISVENWLNRYGSEYQVETLDVKDENWKLHSFVGYDVVFHVAGIAHVSTDPNLEQLYYKVNRDLTVEIAEIAKEQGVKQFVFMSSIIVYGNKIKVITKETQPQPANFYGRSKLEADEAIQKLQSEGFNVVSIRPPMIYGKGSKGNYPKLSKLAQKTFIFPNIKNERSMLHIDNLCEFIRLMIDNQTKGIFYPQNKEYVNTTELVKTIAKSHGKKIYTTPIMNVFILPFKEKVNVLTKVFGTLIYDQSISSHDEYNYCVHDFEASIRATERG